MRNLSAGRDAIATKAPRALRPRATRALDRGGSASRPNTAADDAKGPVDSIDHTKEKSLAK
jgi:hypothetical protein